jgi:2-polyprenyl-3-methyl-5-hydroxy-6-metoxy-1,4-benzoquinol methylase
MPLKERANSGLHDYLFQQWVQPMLPVHSVLDIGCGSGAWLHRLQHAGATGLLGLDADTAQFAAPGIGHETMNFDKYNGHGWGSFELITCIELIEHIENTGLLLDLIANNLDPKGVCIITTPNIHSRNARLRYALKGELGHFDAKSDPTHIYPVYTANLVKLLERRGLMIGDTDGFLKTVSKNYSRPIQTLSGLLRPWLPATWEGDNIIYLIRHR